jgi:hypothetical protein
VHRRVLHASAIPQVTLDGHAGTVTRTLKVTIRGRQK